MTYLHGNLLFDLPDGKYALGLFNKEIAASVGTLISRMTHIEERFTSLLSDLAGCDSSTARLIFRSLQSDPPRIAILKSLVARLQNKEQQSTYLKAIGEFEAIKTVRNGYTHGYWQTHLDSNRAFLTKSLKEEHPILRGTEVRKEEVDDIIIRANMLEYELLKLEHPQIRTDPPLEDESEDVIGYVQTDEV